MPTTKVDNLGSVGLISDKEPITLPSNAWSTLQNIRCKDGSIESFPGHVQIDTITPAPETINFVKTGVQTFIVYAAGNAIYSYWAGSEANISLRTYKAFGKWDSCVLGGVGIFNNGVENPQYWGGSGTALDLPYDSTNPAETCLWSDVGMTARIIRPFRYHLFALDITDCDGTNCRKVHWSHPADPGGLPITWDPTKADFDAGFVELSETPGCILDALTLRDTLQIYKDDAIYAATYTGRQDNQIFNFRVVTTKYGLYSRNCVTDVGGQHFFVSDGDIYLYDGTNFRSIADERVRDLFFGSVSRTNVDNVFCTYDHRTGQVFLCYPEANNTRCNKALVWDRNDNTWSQRDIPDANCAIFAVLDRGSGVAWQDLPTSTWAASGSVYPNVLGNPWNLQIDTSPLYDSLVLGGNQELIEMDSGNTAKGTPFICRAQRTHLELGNKEDYHQVLQFFPIAEGDAFSVRLGFHNSVNDAVTWTAYQTFDPSTDRKLDFRVSGNLHAVEYFSEGDVSWKVSGHEAKLRTAGKARG